MSSPSRVSRVLDGRAMRKRYITVRNDCTMLKVVFERLLRLIALWECHASLSTLITPLADVFSPSGRPVLSNWSRPCIN